ncbi:uncharacterized protein LOC109847723 [Asparagus officinalis]|uniref:uncharacterized protein LOC109847723 n=1 Tax=Asparagus officinalis TaxID=4686 RepID=UPI00098E08D1|nr:uncharacterized protein LOC109847723 [Asparagus officinalis]
MKRLWKTLNEKYLTKSIDNRLYLKKRFYQFKMKRRVSIREHVNNFTNLLSDMSNVDIMVENEDKAMNYSAIQKLKNELSSKIEMNNLGEARKILGMEIERDMVKGRVKLTQRTLILPVSVEDRYYMSKILYASMLEISGNLVLDQVINVANIVSPASFTSHMLGTILRFFKLLILRIL